MKQPLLPRNLKVYLINLDRAQERLQRMRAKCAAVDLPFERVAAVDGTNLIFPCPEFDARSYKYLHGRRVIPAEVGCYLSHVECARRLLESDAEYALILEDDVAFPPDFTRLLQLALADATDWDILRLSTMNTGPKLGYRKLPDGRSFAIALSREKGAGAYIINRKAATWITRDLMPMRLSYDIVFDLEHLAGLRSAFIDPVPVNQRDEGKSQIQNGIKAFKYPRTRYLTVLPYRAWLETSRVAVRLTRYLHLSLRYQPRLALIRAAPTLAALLLGIDEIFDHM